jgi:hypothetical protein
LFQNSQSTGFKVRDECFKMMRLHNDLSRFNTLDVQGQEDSARKKVSEAWSDGELELLGTRENLNLCGGGTNRFLMVEDFALGRSVQYQFGKLSMERVSRLENRANSCIV